MLGIPSGSYSKGTRPLGLELKPGSPREMLAHDGGVDGEEMVARRSHETSHRGDLQSKSSSGIHRERSSSTPMDFDACLALDTDHKRRALLGLNFLPRSHPADAKIGSRCPPLGHWECAPPTRHQTRFLPSDRPRMWSTPPARSMPTNRSFYALFWLTPVGPTPVIDGELVSPGGFQLPSQTSDLRAEVDRLTSPSHALSNAITTSSPWLCSYAVAFDRHSKS